MPIVDKQKKNEYFFPSIISLYLIWLYIFPDYTKYGSIFFTIALIACVLFNQNTVQFNRLTVIVPIYALIGFLSSILFSYQTIDDAIEFLIVLAMLEAIFIYRPSYKEINRLIKGVCILCIICVLGCILQIVNNDLLAAINRLHLDQIKYETYLTLSRGYIVGFSFQTGVTGYYLIVAWGLILCKFFDVESYRLKLVLGLLALIIGVLIFFTGKRIFIGLIFIITLYFICVYYKNHIIKIILLMVFLIIILGILLFTTEFGQHILERTTGDSIDSGRFVLYEKMWNKFLQHPIIGNGFASLKNLGTAQNGHNIYLQILGENGIVGASLMIFLFISTLYNTVKLFLLLLRKKKPMFNVAFCLFIQLLFLGWGVTGNPFYDIYPLILYGVILSATKTLMREEE